MSNLNESDYRKHAAMNFSSLAAFSQSPDHALMAMEYKSYFEYGKMFETMLQDAVSGSKEFEKRFYFTELTNKMPDNLIGWIDNKSDLTEYYEYTKTGKLSGTYKGRHAYLDEAIKNPGMIPVSAVDGEMLKRHVENMLKMRYAGCTVESLLSRADWQVPIIFTDYDTYKKKALLDCLVDESMVIDIKTAASFQKFGYILRDKYWIQGIMYERAVRAEYGACSDFVFFVASKEQPLLCAPFKIECDGEVLEDRFDEICEAYAEWVDAGKPARGYLPVQMIRKWR